MKMAKRVAGALSQRLPPFETPTCEMEGCGSPLVDPRPILTEESGVRGMLRVHVLTRCPVCTAEYKGERIVKVGFRPTAVSQSFHLYNDDDRALVTSLLPKYMQSAEKLAEINAMPVKD